MKISTPRLCANLFGFLALVPLIPAATTTPKPNIVVIMADDLGSADVGYNSYIRDDTTQYLTPNIDKIRADGVSFSTGYVTGNICAVSRMAMLTGRYQNRLGCYSGDPTSDTTIPSNWGTIASRLKEVGYKTFMAGKWHTGSNPGVSGNGPVDRGFDEAWYFMGGKTPYFFTTTNYPGPDTKSPNCIYNNHTAVEPDNISYMTDFWTKYAINFIDSNKDRPFFLYLAYNAVHADIHWPHNEFDTEHTKRQKVVAMGQRMDERIGDIVTKLKTLDLYDNTLIFFLSDNGGVYSGYSNLNNMTSDNRPLKEGKHYSYEGGIRVPFLVSWPNGGFKAGVTTLTNPVISLDIMPTALAAAGSKNVTDLDGSNLLPLLRNEKSLPSRTLFWSGGSDKADNSWSDGDEAWSVVRSHDNYKLLIHRCEMFLYNFNTSNGETESQKLSLNSDVYKARQIDLYRQLIQWQTEMPQVIGDGGVSWDEDQPRYKDNWSFFFPMVKSSEAKFKVDGQDRISLVSGLIEAKEIELEQGETFQPRVIARYSQGNHPYVYPDDQQPSTTWSLVSTIGGSINTSTGKFTAGNRDGYVILKASATFNRRPGLQSEDFVSYQLIKVGNGNVPQTVSYDTWAADYVIRGASALKDADPDEDGASNLFEYALGGDPVSPSDGALIAPTLQVLTSNTLEYSYSRRKDATLRGLSYSLETTSDLSSVNWTPMGNSAESGTVSKDAEFDTVKNRVSSAGKNKLYIRLRINAN